MVIPELVVRIGAIAAKRLSTVLPPTYCPRHVQIRLMAVAVVGAERDHLDPTYFFDSA